MPNAWMVCPTACPPQTRNDGPPKQECAGVGRVESWTHLALFGLVYLWLIVGNEARAASFWHSAHSYAVGQPWPYFRLRWSRHEWSGVAKLLIRLHSVAFGCFSYPPNPHPDPLPEGEGIIQGAGMRGPRLRGNDGHTYPPLRLVCASLSRTLDSSLRWNDGRFRRNDACVDQCKGWRGDGAMGICRLGARFPPSPERRALPSSLRPVCAPLSRTLDSSLRWSICVVSQANAAAGGLLLNAVPRRAMAFSNNNNLRITATSATFPAFPRSRKPR